MRKNKKKNNLRIKTFKKILSYLNFLYRWESKFGQQQYRI